MSYIVGRYMNHSHINCAHIVLQGSALITDVCCDSEAVIIASLSNFKYDKPMFDWKNESVFIVYYYKAF